MKALPSQKLHVLDVLLANTSHMHEGTWISRVTVPFPNLKSVTRRLGEDSYRGIGHNPRAKEAKKKKKTSYVDDNIPNPFSCLEIVWFPQHPQLPSFLQPLR